MKETKPYDLPKEGPKNIVSEPMAEYQSMSSLQLEADKARLIRAIVNIDSKLVFDKVKQGLRDILNLREEVVVEPEPDSKEYIMTGLKEAFLEMKEVKAGRSQSRPAEELLKELMEERDGEDD